MYKNQRRSHWLHRFRSGSSSNLQRHRRHESLARHQEQLEERGSGGYDKRTEWHRIVLWGKLADAAAKLSKGAYVEIEGELRHRSYQKEVQIGKKAVAVDIPGHRGSRAHPAQTGSLHGSGGIRSDRRGARIGRPSPFQRLG